MNTKVVPNPEQKGWEEDGTTPNGTPIYKWESGGGSGGSSLWEQNGSDISYNDGNVSTTGTFSASGRVNTADGITVTSKDASHSRFYSTSANGSFIGFDDSNTTGSWWHQGLGSTGNQLKFKTANQVRLTINNDGTSTFSGTVTSSSLKTDCAKFANNQDHAYLVAGTAGWTGATDNWNTYGFQHRIKTNANGKPRVTIDTALGEKFSVDNDGSATFSGTVSAGEIKVPRSKDGAFSGAFGPSSTDDTAVTLKNAGGSGSSLTLTANNTAEFSGTVDAAGLTINGKPVFESISGDLNGNGWGWRHPTAPNKEGVFLTNNGEFFCPSINGRTSLGTTLQKWRDANLSGTVNSTRMIQDGSPVIDAKGLINTLSTLRNATKDETTLKGMRDALADAIGGLIENLEHEIATMPAPEPEVSTMEIEA